LPNANPLYLPSAAPEEVAAPEEEEPAPVGEVALPEGAEPAPVEETETGPGPEAPEPVGRELPEADPEAEMPLQICDWRPNAAWRSAAVQFAWRQAAARVWNC